jgi:hypothetical protein
MDLSGTRLDGDCVVSGGYEHLAAHNPPLRSSAQNVDTALARLAEQRAVLYYTQQNIAELWNAMTRPTLRNGLGMSIAETELEVRAIESGMSLLPDGEEVYREWRRLVVQYGVAGVQVHDARLAAAM